MSINSNQSYKMKFYADNNMTDLFLEGANEEEALKKEFKSVEWIGAETDGRQVYACDNDVWYVRQMTDDIENQAESIEHSGWISTPTNFGSNDYVKVRNSKEARAHLGGAKFKRIAPGIYETETHRIEKFANCDWRITTK